MELWIVVKAAETETDYQVKVESFDVPRIGDTITIQRVDKDGDIIIHNQQNESQPFYVEQESLIVRAVHRNYAYPKYDNQDKIGKAQDIWVVCDLAVAKYDTPNHKAGAGPDAPRIEFA